MVPAPALIVGREEHKLKSSQIKTSSINMILLKLWGFMYSECHKYFHQTLPDVESALLFSFISLMLGIAITTAPILNNEWME